MIFNNISAPVLSKRTGFFLFFDRICRFRIAKACYVCYNTLVMERRKHLYVSRKNVLTWLMALCLVGSAVTRIVFSGWKGTGGALDVWCQIVLPVAATLLYALIVLLAGKEQFYKTAIPVYFMAFYYAIRPHALLDNNPFVMGLYCICLLFFCIAYWAITCGRVRYIWLLAPLFMVPLAAVGYLHWAFISLGYIHAWLILLPDYLLFFGGLMLTLAIRVHPDGEYHPTWGDRTDGRRIRTLPAMAQVSPYIMVNRNESSNLYAESIEISTIDRYIRSMRKQGYTNFGFTHVLLAAYLRTLCKYPALNRFLAGQKVYSRGNDVQYCMTVKKEMSVDSPDTVIKVHLSPYDTAVDVYNKLQDAVESVKNTSSLDSDFDATAGALTLIPGVVLKFVVWLLKTLDYFGMLPKFLLEVSPFHGSLFFTSMGSLGISPIYHHLYDFGNMPVFGAFGCKRRAMEVLEDGTVVQRKYIDVKFTLDERIVDGYYYAAFFKQFKRILARPEVLNEAPEEVLSDID